MAKRKLSNFDFHRKGCHISAVGPEVGGPANGRTCLIYKGVSSHKTEDTMEKEMIEKSAAAELVQKAVEPIQKALDEANAKLAEIAAKEADAKVAVRKAALEEALGKDNTEIDAKLEVLKSVDDAVFEMVLKGLQAPSKEKEQMFSEVGSDKAVQIQNVEEESAVAKILKARFPQK